MDLNVGHAMLIRRLAGLHEDFRDPSRSDSGLSDVEPAGERPRSTRTLVMREWTGDRLVLLGNRMVQLAAPRAVDPVVPS